MIAYHFESKGHLQLKKSDPNYRQLFTIQKPKEIWLDARNPFFVKIQMAGKQILEGLWINQIFCQTSIWLRRALRDRVLTILLIILAHHFLLGSNRYCLLCCSWRSFLFHIRIQDNKKTFFILEIRNYLVAESLILLPLKFI